MQNAIQANVIALDSWLNTLAQWLPPHQVAHIGASLPAIYQTLPELSLLVLDFDAAKQEQVRRQLPNAQLHFSAQMVAEHTGVTLCHQASSTLESGLVAPEQLQRYWQNLKTVASRTVQASSLDDAMKMHGVEPAWLWLDCLPALAILRGATATLARANVVLARVIIADVDAPADTSLAAVHIFMLRHGFMLAGVQLERHPALGTALFFRDFAKLASAQKQHAQEAAQIIASMEAEKAQLTIAYDVEAQTKAEALTQRDALIQAKTEALTQQAAELQAALEAQVHATSQAQEEQLKQATDHIQHAQAAAQIIASMEAEKAQLTIAYDVEAQTKAEALAQRDALAQAKNEALTQRTAELQAALEAQVHATSQAQEEQSKRAIDHIQHAQAAAQIIASMEAERTQLQSENTALIKHHEQQVNGLQSQNAEFESQQQMLQQELYRAEVQINLIKDLLLREPAL